LLPRQLEEFGPQKGYLLLFTQLGDEASAKALAAVDAMLPAIRDRGVLVVNVNVAKGDAMLDIALDALRRNAPYPSGQDVDGCLQARYGIPRPGVLALLDAATAPLLVGDIEQLEASLLRLDAGETGRWQEQPAEQSPVSTEAPASDQTEMITYHQHLAPVVSANCFPCHAAGGSAPFSLDSYERLAAHSAMVAEVVRLGTMPPWYAHGGDLQFANEPALEPEQRKWFQAWHDAGKLEGEPGGAEVPDSILSKQDEFVVDLRLEASEPVAVPASGFLEYQVVALPYVTEQDVWLQGLRVAPSNPRVMHHALVIAVTPAPADHEDGTYMLALSAVGTQPARFPDGIAAKLPKGSRIAFNIHYEPTGKPEQDTMGIELMFPRAPVRKRARFVGFDKKDILIAPGDPHSEQTAQLELKHSLSLFGILGHMHVRGKAMQVYADHADGRTLNLLTLPAWNFSWQMIYRIKPGDAVLSAGTMVRARALFDNSRQNPYNPDPSVEVRAGKRTTDEMLDVVLMGVRPFEALNLTLDPATQAKAFKHAPLPQEKKVQ
jgi:mono/diheme cytochrome c family protein